MLKTSGHDALTGVRSTIIILATVAAGLTALQSYADTDEPPNTDDAVNDAWLDGRLEASYLFNRHLNAFEIDTQVSEGTVVLTGIVESLVDKELAGAIARGTDGVLEVENRLKVDSNARSRSTSEVGGDRRFGQAIDDATTTAQVKTKLLANDSVSGLAVNVDTFKNKVTLSGNVETSAEKNLIEQIAQDVRYVDEVENNIVVRSET